VNSVIDREAGGEVLAKPTLYIGELRIGHCLVDAYPDRVGHWGGAR